MRKNSVHFSKLTSFYILIFLTSFIFLSFKIDAISQLKVKNSLVKFVSKAPLETISASSDKLMGVIDTSSNQFAFKISMSTFSGFNSKLQKEHFEENYLEVVKFPNATFSGKIIEKVDYSIDGTYSVRAKGNFSIHGISKEFILKSNIRIINNQISISTDFFISLKDFNIPIPQMVKQKISESIQVSVLINLQ